MWMNEADRRALTKKVIKEVKTVAPHRKKPAVGREPEGIDQDDLLFGKNVPVRTVVDFVIEQIKLTGTV